LSRGYGVMQVPLTDVAALPSERRTALPAEAPKPAPPVPSVPTVSTAAVKPAPAPHPVTDEDLKAQLLAAQKGKAGRRGFGPQLRGRRAGRAASAAEPDGERRGLSRLRESTRRGDARAQRAESPERQSRKLLAEAEGTIVRLRAGVPATTAMTMT